MLNYFIALLCVLAIAPGQAFRLVRERAGITASNTTATGKTTTPTATKVQTSFSLWEDKGVYIVAKGRQTCPEGARAPTEAECREAAQEGEVAWPWKGRSINPVSGGWAGPLGCNLLLGGTRNYGSRRGISFNGGDESMYLFSVEQGWTDPADYTTICTRATRTTTTTTTATTKAPAPPAAPTQAPPGYRRRRWSAPRRRRTYKGGKGGY